MTAVDRIYTRISQQFSTWGWTRWDGVIIGSLMLVTLGLQTILWDWVIDDAAISFAYARNLWNGEGLVPFPGGERVEGYSNPLWVFLLAPFQWTEGAGVASAKWLGALLSALTIPLTCGIARKAAPTSGPWPGWFAAFFVAINAQFVIWGTSGLENALFGCLLAAGLYRLAVESVSETPPWSALCFLGLALTRPEGVLYGVVAGLWIGRQVWYRRERWRYVLKWGLMLMVPLSIHQLARWLYFAWPMPNTYYAKAGNASTELWNWDSAGWEYLRRYAGSLWQRAFLPVYLFGFLGLRGWRGGLAILTVVLGAAWLWLPGVLADAGWKMWWDYQTGEEFWRTGVCVLMVLPALFVSLIKPPERGDVRVLCLGMVCTSLFFLLWANGDWMDGFRFLNFLVVPAGVLFAVGLCEMADALARWAGQDFWGPTGWSLVWTLMGALMVPNITHIQWFDNHREDSTDHILRRVQHVEEAAGKVFLNQVVNLDMDQGAHLLFTDHKMVDVAGLVDVPIARHTYRQQKFIREYIFEEKRPHFAHMHRWWARHTGLTRYPEWERDYFELPPYPENGGHHDGCFMRRDLLFPEDWVAPKDRSVDFSKGLSITGFAIPSTTIGQQRSLYIELGMQRKEPGVEGSIMVRVTLSNGSKEHHWDVEPGYGWMAPKEWGSSDVFVGRYALPVPKNIKEGPYRLNFSLLLENKERITSIAGPPDGFDVGIEVVSRKEAMNQSNEDAMEAIQLADAGQCGEAEALWGRAQARLPLNTPWRAHYIDSVGLAMAGCYTQWSVDQSSQSLEHLRLAHQWDHRHPAFKKQARTVGNDWYQQGLVARERGDAEAAYKAFTNVLSIEPTRAWARRYAEEARDIRLELMERR